MYSYEIVFESPDLTLGTIKEQVEKNAVKYKQTSEFIVSDNSEEVLKYVQERMKILDYEFVGVVRRNPIIKIIKKEDAGEKL